MARTMTDRQVNEGARFYPHHEAADDSDITCYPLIELGGVQVYAYAEDGKLVVSLHYDTAGPDGNGNGPWAYYGPDSAVPVVVIGGDGEPVWQATAGGEPGQIPAWLAYAGVPLEEIPDDGQRDAVRRHRNSQEGV